MNVILDLKRQVVVEDMGDSVDVNSPRSNIRSNEYLDILLAKLRHDSFSLRLAFVSMNRICTEPFLVQPFGKLVRSLFFIDKHHRLARLQFVKEP